MIFIQGIWHNDEWAGVSLWCNTCEKAIDHQDDDREEVLLSTLVAVAESHQAKHDDESSRRILLADIEHLRSALEVVVSMTYNSTPGAIMNVKAVARHALDATERSGGPA